MTIRTHTMSAKTAAAESPRLSTGLRALDRCRAEGGIFPSAFPGLAGIDLSLEKGRVPWLLEYVICCFWRSALPC